MLFVSDKIWKIYWMDSTKNAKFIECNQ